MTETIHGVRYETALAYCRAGLDSLALAAFAPARGHVADLCAGAGLIGLLLCARETACRVSAVDCSAAACAEARRNAEANGLSDRFSVIEADLRDRSALPAAGSADGAIANPPYHAASDPVSPDASRAAARSERACSLDEVCAAAAYLVRSGGSFCLVYPAERLADVFAALRHAGFEPKRLRFIRHSAAHPPSLALVQARRCGGVGLRYETDLIVYDETGAESAACRAVCDR